MHTVMLRTFLLVTSKNHLIMKPFVRSGIWDTVLCYGGSSLETSAIVMTVGIIGLTLIKSLRSLLFPPFGVTSDRFEHNLCSVATFLETKVRK